MIISPIKTLVGTSGILQVSELTINSFEIEDHLVVTAITENGELLEEEIAKKLFMLHANIQQKSIEIVSEDLMQKEQDRVDVLTAHITFRNMQFFDEEVDKLDKWSDDVKKSLEIELKRLDIDIKTMKTTAKKVLKLEEKVKLQREIKEMERKRNEMRQRLYQSQDEVDEKKENLLQKVEAQLKQKIERKELFTIQWKIV